MSRLEKLVAKIQAVPGDAEFTDVSRVLEAYGWTLARQKGSHITFTKSGERSIVVPTVRGRRVQRIYLSMILNRLGLEK